MNQRLPIPPRIPPPLPPRMAATLRRTSGGRGATRAKVAELLPPLDLKLLAELPSLTLRARYLVDGFLAGRHRSPKKGASVEFTEYRDYQPGDEPRRVDWRLYARTDRLHIREYEDETRLRVFFILDPSASMDFVSRPGLLRKIEFARLMAAALGSLARRQGDGFGLGIARTELEDFLAARTSAAHWKTFVGRLEALRPGGVTLLPAALVSLANVLPARSLVVILGDFYEDLEPLRGALNRLRYDRHELLGLQVLDPVELDFDLEVAGQFVDAEDGGGLPLNAAAARSGYLERFRRHCTDLTELFRQAGGECAQLRTDRPPLAALAEFLARRERCL